jgi:hypothetical protein
MLTVIYRTSVREYQDHERVSDWSAAYQHHGARWL